MSQNDRPDESLRGAFWRGFAQAAIVSLAALAIIVALWLAAHRAPSAGGVPLATVAPTPVMPAIRFDATAFPTAKPLSRATPTPAPAISDATVPSG
ncbi:MAG TPA: hypothetical protein VFX03_08640 [Thermomicrobiales bacterium]|nr:hypothetical protein [Thermomicrobiales bacterium]